MNVNMRRLGVMLLGVLLVAGLSVGTAYLLLARFPSVPLSEDDLVEVHSDLSTMRIPRQWQQFSTNVGVQFGNTTKDGSSSAVVTLLDTGFFQTNLVDASVEDIKSALEYAEPLTELTSAESNDCRDKKDIITTSEFPKLDNNTRELVRKAVECSTPSGKRVIKNIRVVVGRDAYLRGAVLTVRTDDWRLNEKVYERMLDSITQRVE